MRKIEFRPQGFIVLRLNILSTLTSGEWAQTGLEIVELCVARGSPRRLLTTLDTPSTTV